MVVLLLLSMMKEGFLMQQQYRVIVLLTYNVSILITYQNGRVLLQHLVAMAPPSFCRSRRLSCQE